MASVSFPVIGTVNYRNAFSAFARDRKTSMAELVRRALDEQYGVELERYLSFFDPTGKETFHPGSEPADAEAEHAPSL